MLADGSALADDPGVTTFRQDHMLARLGSSSIFLVVSSDEGPEEREREPFPGLLLRLLHVRRGNGALLPRQPAGPAGERRRQAGLDVQVLAAPRPH